MRNETLQYGQNPAKILHRGTPSAYPHMSNICSLLNLLAKDAVMQIRRDTTYMEILRKVWSSLDKLLVVKMYIVSTWLSQRRVVAY